MLDNIFILITSLFFVIFAAELAIKHSIKLAHSIKLTKYAVGVLMVAIISALPDAFISATSAINGVSEIGLSLLLGASVTILTLVIGITVLLSGVKNLPIKKGILTQNKIFPFLLFLPIIFGLDGYYSRIDGLTLIVTGIIFYYFVSKNNIQEEITTDDNPSKKNDRAKTICWLAASLIVLSISANFVVSSSVALAEQLKISPILISMIFISLGTSIPEFVFSYKALKKQEGLLALGNILGAVLMNVTVVVGLLALIHPFIFPKAIIYVTGGFMVFAAFLLFSFMKSDRKISRVEAAGLIIFWLVFVLVQFVTQHVILGTSA